MPKLAGPPRPPSLSLSCSLRLTSSGAQVPPETAHCSGAAAVCAAVELRLCVRRNPCRAHCRTHQHTNSHNSDYASSGRVPQNPHPGSCSTICVGPQKKYFSTCKKKILQLNLLSANFFHSSAVAVAVPRLGGPPSLPASATRIDRSSCTTTTTVLLLVLHFYTTSL